MTTINDILDDQAMYSVRLTEAEIKGVLTARDSLVSASALGADEGAIEALALAMVGVSPLWYRVPGAVRALKSAPMYRSELLRGRTVVERSRRAYPWSPPGSDMFGGWWGPVSPKWAVDLLR